MRSLREGRKSSCKTIHTHLGRAIDGRAKSWLRPWLRCKLCISKTVAPYRARIYPRIVTQACGCAHSSMALQTVVVMSSCYYMISSHVRSCHRLHATFFGHAPSGIDLRIRNTRHHSRDISERPCCRQDPIVCPSGGPWWRFSDR